MRGGRLALAILVMVVGLGAAGGTRFERAEADAPREYVEVRFDTGVTVESLNAEGTPPTLEELGYRVLAVPEGTDRDAFLAELRARPDVLGATPAGRVHAAAIPNDPYYPSQPGPNQAQYLTQIGAPAAWDLSTGSQSVTVAVVDSGLDLGHPDFAGQLWENPIDNRSDGIDRDNNGCVNDRYGCRFVTLTAANRDACGYTSSLPSANVMDDMGKSASDSHSHGTLVSGIIGAVGNNGIGVTGVAWTTRLLPVKVLDCQGAGIPFDVARGIVYAVQRGARVINVSIETDSVQPSDLGSLRDAVQIAQNAGVIVVAAAGNYGSTAEPGTRYPAAFTEFPNVIAVGASNNLNGNLWASYSSYGPALDFAAPGNKLVSTARSDLLSNPYAEVGDPSFGFSGGTSYSAALVSGMFALMVSRNSRLPAGDLIQVARDAATPAQAAPHGQNWAGSGIINIGAAVARVPMTIEGAPLHDWRDVKAGTPVEAIVGGVSCGTTTTDSFGLLGRFEIRVRADAEQAGCGQPGKTVQLFIGGAPAQPTYPWGAPNTDMGFRDQSVSSVSPPPGSLVVQALNGSWANIAHLEPSGQLPGAVSGLPTPWTSIFKWDPLKTTLAQPGAYRRFFRGEPAYASDYPVISRYDAYWVDAPAQNVASPNPSPPAGRAVALQKGWNNITYTGQSRSVADALSSVDGKYTQVLQYDNGTGEWLSYVPVSQTHPRYLNDFGGLFTLKVYWVLMTEDATLVMN